jgi:hypothetical protein
VVLAMIESKYSTEKFEEAIRISGYLLESRVATKLRSAKYRTSTNPVFFDPETNKSREYDINAYKTIPVYPNGDFDIYPTLICQCKNNSYPIVFFVDKEHDFKPLLDEVRVSGMPSKIWSDTKSISVQEFLKVGNYHHFCTPKAHVTTQCCTFEKTMEKTKEGMKEGIKANYGSDLYETNRTLTKVLEFEIDEDFKNISRWMSSNKKGTKFMDLSFYYPVVIYQGDIHVAHVDGDNVKMELSNHIQFNPEFYSHYYEEVISYHIDVISEDYLPYFLNIIDLEMNTIKKKLQQQKEKVLLSIKKGIEECANDKNQLKTFRKILELE